MDSGFLPGPFRYRPLVLEKLCCHGIQPTPRTRPDLVREFVRDLYKFEIRKLRGRMLRGEFPRREYAQRVEQLRNRYAILALLPSQLVEQDGPTFAGLQCDVHRERADAQANQCDGFGRKPGGPAPGSR
jgi:hypothetical protein